MTVGHAVAKQSECEGKIQPAKRGSPTQARPRPSFSLMSADNNRVVRDLYFPLQSYSHESAASQETAVISCFTIKLSALNGENIKYQLVT
jgi:hypothetical protein